MSDASGRVEIGDRVKLRRRGKKKVWTAEFSRNGKHCRASMKTANLVVAKERAVKLAAELVDHKFRPPPPPQTYLEAVGNYLATLTANGRCTATTLKYRPVLAAFGGVLAAAGVTTVGHMSPAHLDQFLIDRSKSHHPATRCHHARIVKQFAKWLHRRRLIVENPFTDIPLFQPTREPKERPSLDQVNRLLRAASPRLRPLLAALAFTGSRVGEVRRLRPEDVDLAGNWVWVRSRPGAETKTRTERKVPIHERLRPVLDAAVAAARGPHLFTTKPSRTAPEGLPINSPSLNRQYKQLVASLGMPTGRAAGFTLHSLRRFFESHTVNAGIPQRVIDAWLGHASDKSMGAVYYSLRDEESQGFMRKVPFWDGPPATDAGKEG
jgi:integrase